MAFETFDRLVQRSIIRLYQVPGSGVEQYAEDILAEQLQHAFDVLFEEFWFPDYSGWITGLTLDGTVGIITSDISAEVKQFTDIYGVWAGNDEKPLAVITPQTNPNRLGSNGAYPRGVAPYPVASKVFQVFPQTSTSPISLYRRKRPDSFLDNGNVIVKIDDQLMILKAVWDYLVDDGNNPSAADKFLGLYEARLVQIQHSLNRGPIALTNEVNTIPTGWSESDS